MQQQFQKTAQGLESCIEWNRVSSALLLTQASPRGALTARSPLLYTALVLQTQGSTLYESCSPPYLAVLLNSRPLPQAQA